MGDHSLTAKELQPVLVKKFQRIISQQKLAHAYLFVGPDGSGKDELALWLALSLFCEHPHNGQPDLTCDECQRILTGNHPDVVVAQAEGRQIKVDQIRHIKEEFTKTGMEGSQKVFIIQDADKMTVNAANSLLKFIEEPGPGIFIFMLTNNKNAVLPTIQSRTQIVELPPLAKATLKNRLAQRQIPVSLQPIILGLTDSVSQAAEWVQNDWLAHAVDAVLTWFKELCHKDPIAFVVVQTVMKGLAENRQQQQIMLDLMALIWRDALVMVTKAGEQSQLYFENWASVIQQAVVNYKVNDIVECGQITLEAHQLLQQNISFQNVVEQQTLRILKLLTSEK